MPGLDLKSALFFRFLNSVTLKRTSNFFSTKRGIDDKQEKQIKITSI